MILQLAKTSPYLSGQWKLDIELLMDGRTQYDSYGNVVAQPHPVTSACHVTPLSPSIVYTDTIKRPFFNYSLSENIRLMYKKIGDDMFKDMPVMKNDTVICSDRFEDPYDHVYQCGLRRERYNKYNKQFSLLCPIWITKETDIDAYRFRITINGESPSVKTAVTYIEFSKELKASLKEYLKGVSTDLLNINLDRESIDITGLEVGSATVMTKDVSYIMDSLFDRERPVIETDSVLCQLLPSNGMIARQLINLNFVFNLNDVFSPYMADQCIGKRWNIYVDVVDYDGNCVDFKDLYTNYWSIPSYVATERAFNPDYNALDYLEDNRCSDLILVNKTTQPNFHWSLVDNPSYMYNLYNGMSPVNSAGKGLVEGLFFEQPNPYIKKYDSSNNSTNWCRHINCTGNSRVEVEDLISDPNFAESLTKFTIEQKNSVQWVNGMKMMYTNESLSGSDAQDNISLALDLGSTFILRVGIVDVGLTDTEMNGMCTTIVNTIGGSNGFVDVPTGQSAPACADFGTGVKAIAFSDTSLGMVLIIFVNDDILNHTSGTDPQDYITLNSVLSGAMANNNQIWSAPAVHSIIENLVAVFKSYVHPWTIVFKKSLAGVRTDSPDHDSLEIDYFKSDLNIESKLYRYTGNLQPMFISIADSSNYNYDFFRRQFRIKDDSREYEEFNKKILTGYKPMFPSTGFFTLEEPARAKYTLPAEHADGTQVEYGSREVTWYKDSLMYVLPETVKINNTYSTASVNGMNQDSVVSMLSNYLHQTYGIDIDAAIDLSKKYDYRTTYDYVNSGNTPSERIGYTTISVTFKLK